MGTLTITIVVATDPAENVQTRVQAVGMAEHEVRPTLDRAIQALQAERKALEACPYHALRPRIVTLIHRALAGDFVGVFTATEQVKRIDKLADDILALARPAETPSETAPPNRLAQR